MYKYRYYYGVVITLATYSPLCVEFWQSIHHYFIESNFIDYADWASCQLSMAFEYYNI